MNVKLCVGSRCTMMGSNGILDALENLVEDFFQDGSLTIEPVNCMNLCKNVENANSPVVSIDGDVITRASAQEVCEAVLKRANKLVD
ncbi:NAD(P)H-dependent oxidoreductase subunit E [Peptoniphilus sp. KCTC 25270]|uniref:NAD(P)H-dependent oxidoreductase subunit E n=1 Tax=Peptoniphilus sp. KCTC 25270 TaxID=2897414 RepID=UPI001E4F70CF|nr:NAD(P)H-dependent oxidoreductase subunit E [Peptoniphilus sp. KCTC 25270]MCD1146595.1 NAD(P)H-dependent oxidoreductase subunit E [Peptoniphilus sp. KCTC 25270]